MAREIISKIPEEINFIQVQYTTPDLPPPFCFSYKLEADVSEDQLEVYFSIHYTDREEIEDEEIIAEGYTLDDDYEFKGTLPGVWASALLEQLQKTSWIKNGKQSSHLNIRLASVGQKEDFEGSPSEVDSWEYFLQEMIQAIFESGKKEMPLEVVYKEIIDPSNSIMIVFKASFLHRRTSLEYFKGKDDPQHFDQSWKSLKKILKPIYMPDYHPELAQDKIPDKVGKYISPGDGKWYKFGKGVTNPGTEVNSLEILEKQLREMIRQE